MIKIYKSELVDRNNLSPSQILQTKTELYIGCGNGCLKILELQKEGSRRMTTEEFLRGYCF